MSKTELPPHLARIATPLRLAQYMAPKVMGRPYHPYPWLQYVERETLAMLARPGREVQIVSAPPQEGKTSYFGFWFPSWYCGLNPDNLEMFIGYNEEYASSWGRRVRDFIDMYGEELFGVGLNKSEQSVSNWRTTRGFGGMLSAGINGGITGNPGHIIIIDDVIKTMGEALSPTTRKSHHGEWDGSITARFQEDTKVFITATRWHEEDLSGEVWARSQAPGYEGVPVRRVLIKAHAEPDEEEAEDMTPRQLKRWRDPLGRKLGEPLEGQHSAGFFREKKASISTYIWEAQYQANPAQRKGSMFPPESWAWFDPADPPPMSVYRRVWDMAATEGGGDYTVGAKVAKSSDGHWYVLDVVRVQLSGSKVKQRVKSVAVSDGRAMPIRMEREKAGAGKSLIDLYRVELRGWDFDECRAEGTKLDRFGPYSIEQQEGRVHLPRHPDGTSPSWVEAFIEEHRRQMPDGRGPKNDDQIDTVAYAVLEMFDLGPVEATNPNEDFRPDAMREHADIAYRQDIGTDVYGPLPNHLARLLGRDVDEAPVDSLVGQ